VIKQKADYGFLGSFQTLFIFDIVYFIVNIRIALIPPPFRLTHTQKYNIHSYLIKYLFGIFFFLEVENQQNKNTILFNIR